MSGAAFEGLEQALAGREVTEDYTPGDRGYAPEMLLEMVRWYDDDTTFAGSSWPEGVSRFRDTLKKGTTPAFSPQQFIDDVIGAVASAGWKDAGAWAFFDPLVQALYERGHHALMLDLSPLGTQSMLCLGHSLRGRKGNPLDVTYRGVSAFTFGGGSEHCRIALVGDVNQVGSNAAHAEFTVAGKSTLESLGKMATGCTFRVADLYAGGYPVLKGWPYCPNTYLNELLVERHNSLFHKDASGAWVGLLAEVRP